MSELKIKSAQQNGFDIASFDSAQSIAKDSGAKFEFFWEKEESEPAFCAWAFARQ